MPDVAGYASDQVLRGFSVAGYGWATMAVGNQFGYLATSRALSLPIAGRPSLYCAMTGLPGRQGKQSLAAGDSARDQEDDLRCRTPQRRRGRVFSANCSRRVAAQWSSALRMAAAAASRQ